MREADLSAVILEMDRIRKDIVLLASRNKKLSDPEVVVASERLDQLLNLYYRLFYRSLNAATESV